MSCLDSLRECVVVFGVDFVGVADATVFGVDSVGVADAAVFGVDSVGVADAADVCVGSDLLFFAFLEGGTFALGEAVVWRVESCETSEAGCSCALVCLGGVVFFVALGFSAGAVVVVFFVALGLSAGAAVVVFFVALGLSEDVDV